MPHYHNFGWYYFVKYVVGFAGMLFLYYRFLRENDISCSCEAEELSRRKGDKAPCSRLFRKLTDLLKTTKPCLRYPSELNLPSYAGADASGKHRGSPTPATRRRKRERRVVSPRGVEPEYPENRELRVYASKYQTSLSSSDGNADPHRRRKHRSGCRRALAHRNGRYRSPTVLDSCSSQSSKSTPVCRHFENDDKIVLDPIARANVRVRNSFAEQEYQELEALARSIFTQETSREASRLQDGLPSSCSSSSNSSLQLRITALPSGLRSDSQKSCSYDLEPRKVHAIRPRKASRACRKYSPESASRYLASVQSPKGSVHVTALYRGRRNECKIHGRRYINDNVRSKERTTRCRVSQEADEIINRRKLRAQETRYRSTAIGTL